MRQHEFDNDIIDIQPVIPELGDGSIIVAPSVSEYAGETFDDSSSYTQNCIDTFRLPNRLLEMSADDAQDLIDNVNDNGNIMDYVDDHKVPGVSIRQCSTEADFDSVLNPLEKSFNQIKKLVDINGLLSDIKEGQSFCDDDKRVELINDILKSFRDAYPAAELDSDQPGSLYWTERFMNFYAESLMTIVEKEQLVGSIESWRQDFCTALEIPALSRLLTKTTRKRVADIGLTTPVEITDPLTTLLAEKNKTELSYTYGYFEPDTRSVTIDPFTIRYFEGAKANRERYFPYKNRSKTELDERLNVRIRKTLFHELIHAASNNYYRDITKDDQESAPQRQVGSFWTSAWCEAMTEKLAYLMSAEFTEDTTASPKSNLQSAEEIYLYESNNPRQIGSTPRTRQHNNTTTPSYPKYRLLVDSLFDRLDWKAAGMTQFQAEKLAFNAFLEPQRLPSDTTKPENFRLKFVQAINAAAHPGFMMKFNTLTNMYGAELMTDLLVDPAFNPKDPLALPWFGSHEEAEYSLYKIKSYPSILATAKMLEEISPNSGYQTVNEVEEAYERASTFHLARIGLLRILRARHPERKAIDAETRLHLAIFGSKSMKFPQLVPRPPIQLDEANEDLQNWRVLNTKS